MRRGEWETRGRGAYESPRLRVSVSPRRVVLVHLDRSCKSKRKTPCVAQRNVEKGLAGCAVESAGAAGKSVFSGNRHSASEGSGEFAEELAAIGCGEYHGTRHRPVVQRDRLFSRKFSEMRCFA